MCIFIVKIQNFMDALWANERKLLGVLFEMFCYLMSVYSSIKIEVKYPVNVNFLFTSFQCFTLSVVRMLS